MKNSILIINPKKAENSKLGYDEIRIINVNFNQNCTKNDADDYFMGLLYDCECCVKICGEIFSTIIPLVIIEEEIKNGIYMIFAG